MMMRWILTLMLLSMVCFSSQAQPIDLSRSVIVVRSGDRSPAEAVAADILTEEIAKRTGLKWPIANKTPESAGAIIRLGIGDKTRVPPKPESFRIRVIPASPNKETPPVVEIFGADGRGVMFGVGKLLRTLDWGKGRVGLDAQFSCALSPNVPLRGHQIGYRARANSWDAWTLAQFDQYFREMAIFGANAVENIPFEDSDDSPLMKIPRGEMNLKFGELCAKYDLDHWVWIPVQFEVPDPAKEVAFLKKQDDFYRNCKRLDAVFVPGGDPGDNHAKHLLPFLEKMAKTLATHHPQAKVWLSLQGFKKADVDDFYTYVKDNSPLWLGGVVMGPSSPSLAETRKRLPKRYPIRWYPDITHTIRCQYPVPWWDPAYGMTLGREPVNPRPTDMAAVYRMLYRNTNGFLTYSDGVHDDFNKSVWSLLGWEPDLPVREIAKDYARFFFQSNLADSGADALLALETNWRGALATNGSVDATLIFWQLLATQLGDTSANWRFEMHLMRAYYDFYTRHRLLNETRLEKETLAILANANTLGISKSIDLAKAKLLEAGKQPILTEDRLKIESLAESLFKSIGLQTSVKRYQASGSERGAVLDFLDYPLNNRWFLEDQLGAIAKMPIPGDQLKAIQRIVDWENPGPGGYYDVLGHVARSPRMAKMFDLGDAMKHYHTIPVPTQRNMGEGRRPLRMAWHVYQDEIPEGLAYDNLEPNRDYIVRLYSQRESPLMIDDKPARLIRKGESFDQVTLQEFEVPKEALKDGKITLTWAALDERHLNWRNRHYVTDIWVMRKPD